MDRIPKNREKRKKFSSSSCASLAMSLGWVFSRIRLFFFIFFFFTPTIEVVTFHLRGWCMLGVFLSPAFTRLGHEMMNVRVFWVRLMEYMYAQTRPWFLLSSERVLGESSQNPTPKGKIPSTGNPEEAGTHDAASPKIASPTHYRLNYSGPRKLL